jgi:acyl transferase domain-containing protein
MTIHEDNISPGLDIAIIGMAGRFPGADNIEEFWDNIKNGVESISFFSDQELETSGVFPRSLKNPNYVKANGIIQGFEYFDAAFFGYTPREAEQMDPQMRLFHQCVWHALEDAGYEPDAYNSPIGLYGGATNNAEWILYTRYFLKGTTVAGFATGALSDKDHMNTSISYRLNLTGPSLVMETQCSTSLVAVHLACQGLLSGECDMALAGGVSVAFPAATCYLYTEGLIYSADGHCRSFDSKANGTIFGDGVGVVVLKRIEDAAADGDHIYALVKGTAINNDGSRKAGYPAPSVEGQVEVIRAALQVAQTDPESISCIEAHGTGTSLGDPIEIEALKLAFNTDKKGFCRIGSVKSNIGHLDNASGVTGLIKMVLALKHKLIPPSLHFETPNPKIDFENSPFRVNTQLSPWESDEGPRRAAVSSFGVGGTNAHVVLEEAPVIGHSSMVSGEKGKEKEFQLILLSARTETALDNMTENLAKHFEKNPNINLADAAYTLHLGRKAFRHRRMMVCSTVQETIDTLGGAKKPKSQTFDTKEKKLPVILMCPPVDTDAIAAYRMVGAILYPQEPVFRRETDQCLELLKSVMGDDIKEILYPSTRVNRSNMSYTSYKSYMSNINPPGITQLVPFIFEYALVKLLLSRGVQPAIIVGQGPGEIAAACLTGELSLEQALNRSLKPSNPDLQKLAQTGVSFIEKVKPWLDKDKSIFVEAGVGETLIGIIKKHSNKKPGQLFISLLNIQHRGDEQENPLRGLTEQLGRLWLYGAAVDGKTYYSAEKRQRVPLPGYCFDKQRYLTDNLSNGIPVHMQTPSSRLGKKANIDDWFYIPSWERSFFREQAKMPTDERWLVFMDQCGIGSGLIKQLKSHPQCPSCIRVSQGTTFEKINNSQFVIDPGQAGHYDKLCKELKEQGNIPGRILHLWGVSTDENRQLSWEENDRVQCLGFYSLLNIVQAWGRESITRSIQLEVITTNMQEVTGEETINPGKATILGAVKVIPREYPHIKCRSIDILLPGSSAGTPDTPTADDSTGHDLFPHLLSELSSEPTARPTAFRGKYRWEQVFKASTLEKAADQVPVFKPLGVYLITGGLGGMGYTFARHLAANFQARLILTGRSANQDKQQGKIQELEALGAQVMAAAADVSLPGEMQEVVRQAIRRFGQINGIIHTAGVADYAGIIQRRTREITQQILAPKVTGTLVLHRIIKDMELTPDFLVLCSSISAITGPFGEVGYTAANAFLDAYAHYNNSTHHTPTLSINWGAWQEVGMAVDALKRSMQKKAPDQEQEQEPGDGLKNQILPGEGIEALTRAVASGFPQVIISTQDFSAVIEETNAPQPGSLKKNLSRPRHPRPELATPYAAPRSELEKTLAELLANFLGMDKIGINDNFFELGITSMDILQINEQLKTGPNIKRDVPVVTMFTYPTINELTRYLSSVTQKDDEKMSTN